MVASVVALALFLVVERRAAEPVLPLRLFGNRAFAVASAVGLIVGFALFGSVTYLPLFLQVVKGVSPTASGLQMLPMMGGMLLSSIVSGQVISRTGRYKVFPIVGTAVMSAGLFLLSRMRVDTPTLGSLGMMLLLGLGLGMVMQVLVIAVQNAVAYQDLGVATAGAILFRLIGGSVGTAVLGAIFAARLRVNLAPLLPAGATGGGGGASGALDPRTLAQLPPPLRAAYAEAFTASLSTVFLVATTIAVLGFLLIWLLPERPLRETIAAAAAEPGEEAGGAFAMPRDDDSAAQLLRGLAVLADRDVQRGYIERVVARAGLTLSAAAAWLLVRIERDPTLDVSAVRHANRVPPERMHAALAELRAGGLVEPAGAGQADGARPRYALTDRGCEVLGQLVTARRAQLADLFADWAPEQQEELAGVLRRLARDLVPEAPVRGRS
jgi:DNA-binding MarR family transcriptional regulator